ncbi:cytochrome P450 [Rhodococcus sp. BP-349]|uniref:cytochrome P450 n=1 Tax=unclassified Rhodococcus (in: high G+C Gram-positive bacteria) TaxID=192944 RepID=UPI001C9B5578|nr:MULTISPECIES: cytochrome P450 [unclassified Rhodococcus (in: high G+C Gram-positive bacteria)]MBY6537716.1 cytochrome P450 [Rhodococcus sp. BP-363]MBY6542053.1 cytochrome P450 [Rhodococcus sp. BP-369]MBY6561283.1 cytochrome P450 [Rhodococcus sp. BP-370]MBY6575575.1 cytochrome P450 [Rhodococcus sp. BP-364]MBY6584876.1 cytochrome P450 [Rhodococcus sp. BP-358]
MSTSSRAPVSDADPYDLEILADPSTFHRHLRETGPVVYLERYGVYAMGRFDHVSAALTDWQSYQSSAGVGIANFRFEKPIRPPSPLLEADPPRHDAPRLVLSKILGAPAVQQLRASWSIAAESLVDELLSDSTEFDGIDALSNALPLKIFADEIGIPDTGREHLLPLGDFVFNSVGPLDSALMKASAQKVHEAGSVEWTMAHCRRENLTDNGFGAQVWYAADRGDITEQQAPILVRSLLSAGFDTTASGLAAVLYALASHPEQWMRLRDDPTRARTAFDEAIRWDSPVQTFHRTATRDMSIDGTDVPDGAKVLLSLGAANHDPRRWDSPDSYDLTRDPSGHVGFGMGIHRCVGQHVARLEAEVLLTALAARISTISLAGETERHLNNTMRSWKSLPLRVSLR